MSERRLKEQNAKRRTTRTRSHIHGTAERPRLSVHVSNKHVSAQLINDDNATSLTAVTSSGGKISGTMSEKSAKIGADIAHAAKKLKVKKAVFDRGSKSYHGRIKALADAARENGLEF